MTSMAGFACADATDQIVVLKAQQYNATVSL